jgi:hypothetical protein
MYLNFCDHVQVQYSMSLSNTIIVIFIFALVEFSPLPGLLRRLNSNYRAEEWPRLHLVDATYLHQKYRLVPHISRFLYMIGWHVMDCAVDVNPISSCPRHYRSAYGHL